MAHTQRERDTKKCFGIRSDSNVFMTHKSLIFIISSLSSESIILPCCLCGGLCFFCFFQVVNIRLVSRDNAQYNDLSFMFNDDNFIWKLQWEFLRWNIFSMESSTNLAIATAKIAKQQTFLLFHFYISENINYWHLDHLLK